MEQKNLHMDDIHEKKPVRMAINSSLTNENSETFNFGVKDGVRGFFTNPSRADDSFIPFSTMSLLDFQSRFSGDASFTYSVPTNKSKLMLIFVGGSYNYSSTISTTKGNCTLIKDDALYPNTDGHGYVPRVQIYEVANCSGATITITSSESWGSKQVFVLG